MQVNEIDTRKPEGRLLITAIYLLGSASGPTETRGKVASEILQMLEEMEEALDNHHR